ncbi:FAD-dependent oxidoreductase [Phormidesmis sp. 146-12]
MTAATPSTTRTYDIIGFGDEVPGILAIVAAAREYRRRIGKFPKSLIMFKGNSQEGVGGHLVRGGLAYLDRTHVPSDIRQATGVGLFGDPSRLYTEFLQRSGVPQIALDPRKANTALRQMLSEISADIISRVQIQAILKQGAKISGIQLMNGETYLAKQFIDSTVNAELAQYAGADKLQGFGTFGLPESELPVTLVFETEGLTIAELKSVEMAYLKRFTNPRDTEAQRFMQLAAGGDARIIERFKKEMFDSKGALADMNVGSDHIDICSKALSIAYHAYRGTKFSLNSNSCAFDSGNIAILPGGRLSWNALLCHVSGSQAEALARNAAKPTPAMLEEIKFLDRFFKSLGATAVRPMPELYIRHAGNVTGVVEPLSGARMLEGGVSREEAIATFGYPLDVRGGIEGLGLKALERGITSISFLKPPLFNVGIRHALLRSVPNLAVISPASGFDGYACAAGRIVEFNVAVGQGVGIAAALAITTNRDLMNISNTEVRQVLSQTKQLPIIYGKNYSIEASRLQQFEKMMIA